MKRGVESIKQKCWMVLCSLQIIRKKTNVLQARCVVNYFAIKERLGKKKTNWKNRKQNFHGKASCKDFATALKAKELILQGMKKQRCAIRRHRRSCIDSRYYWLAYSLQGFVRNRPFFSNRAGDLKDLRTQLPGMSSRKAQSTRLPKPPDSPYGPARAVFHCLQRLQERKMLDAGKQAAELLECAQTQAVQYSKRRKI